MISVKEDDLLGKDVINNRLVSIVLPGADVSHQVAHARLQLLEVHLKTTSSVSSQLFAIVLLALECLTKGAEDL